MKKEAFEIAVGRAERAVRYAERFPERINPQDKKYQDAKWQYENEALKQVHPVETRIEK